MDNLKNWLESYLASKGCSLYALEWDTKTNPPVLRVVIDKADGVDLDICAECSDGISAHLDETDEIKGEYLLEVCSPGAERELRSDEAVLAQVGKYVRAVLKNPANGVADVTGTLESADENGLTIKYFVKGRPKKITIPKDNLAVIKTAVKL
jgi:ribosome maturation factor RimP